MENTKVFLLVLCLAVCVEMGWPWGEDVVEDASFADWAYHKISHGFGLKDDDVKNLAENAKFQSEDAASKAANSMKSTTSGATKYATKAAEDDKKKAKGAYDEAAKKTRKASNTIGNKATDAYDQAKDKVGEAYKSTKETVTKGSP